MTGEHLWRTWALLWAVCGSACLSTTAITGLDTSGSSFVADVVNLPAGAAVAAHLTLHVARSDGSPLDGAAIAFTATGCVATPAAGVTNAQGDATLTVTCAATGQYLVSAALQVFGQTQNLGPTVALLVYAPADGKSTVHAGTPLNLQATARDAAGAVNVRYLGTAHATCTDPDAQIPADYRFDPEDFGSKTWMGAFVLASPGTQTVTVRDAATGALLGTQDYVVEGGTVANLVLVAPPAVQAGAPFAVSVRALDLDGSPVVNYRGTVHVSSSDSTATLPPDVVFSDADRGVVALPGLALGKVGAQSLTAADTHVSGLQSGLTYVAVQPGPAARLRLSLPANAVAGQPMMASVQPQDAYGNSVPAFSGAVRFSSDDASAVLPADANVAGSVPATLQFPGLTLKRSGSRTVTVRDLGGVLQAGVAAVGVAASDVQSLALQMGASCASGTAAGTPCDVTVTARDAFGNPAAGYAGTVVFSSTDARATLPPPYAFGVVDGGVLQAPAGVTFKTTGPAQVTVADIGNSALVGGSPLLPITHAPLARISLALPSQAAACAPLSPTVSALDTYDNLVNDYTGTVHFTVTANTPLAVPADVTFTSADGGTKTLGQQLILRVPAALSQVQAADTAAGLTGNANIAIVAGPAAGFNTNDQGNTHTLSQGAGAPVKMFPMDACGNQTADYAGTVQAFPSDPCATMDTPIYTYTRGTYSFWFPVVRYRTLGNQNVTLVDNANASLRVTDTYEIYHACTPYGTSMYPAGVAAINTTTAYKSTPASMAMDSNRRPLLAWADNRYGANQTMLEAYNGSSWQGIAGSVSQGGISQNSNDNSWPALAMAPGNTPAVAWVQAVSGGNSAILFRMKAGSAWAPLGGSDAAPGVTGTASVNQDAVRLVVSNSNMPTVAWRRLSDNSVHVASYNGSVWASLGSDPPALGPDTVDPAGALSLALDSAQRPWLAWTATVSGKNQVFVARWTGSAWAGVGGSASGTGVSASTCGAQWGALALDASDKPYLAWTTCDGGNDEIYVATYNGSSWAGLASSNSGGGISNNSGSSTQPSLALSSAGQPMVAWLDTTFRTSVYMRAYSGGAWQESFSSASRTGLTNNTGTPTRPQILAGAADMPVVAFSNGTVTFVCGWK